MLDCEFEDRRRDIDDLNEEIKYGKDIKNMSYLRSMEEIGKNIIREKNNVSRLHL